MPKTASGTRATTQSNTFIRSSKPIVSRSTTAWIRRLARWPAARRGSSTRPMPRARVESDQLGQVVLREGLADALGISSISRSVTLFWAGAVRRYAGLGQRARPLPGLIRFVRRQADAHGDQGVDEVIDHHPDALAALDVVGHDRAEDRQHHQRRGQTGRGRSRSAGA